MKKRLMIGMAASALALASVAPAAALDASCWGAASAQFAQDGYMGEHSSDQAVPRAGLRNLARELAELGVIPDDSMAALGAFVAEASLYDIEACDVSP